MRPTISQLAAWDLAGLRAAAQVADDNAVAIYDSLTDSSRAMDAAQDWRGRTRDAAWRRTNEEIDHGHEVRALLVRFADEAQDAHREFEAARKYVLAQRAAAQAAGCAVDDAGYVTHPDGANSEAGVHQLNILAGMDEIERIDTTYGEQLAAIRSDLTAIRDGLRDIVFQGVPRDPDDVVTQLAGMTAEERAAAVAQLGADDVRALVIANPDLMGNLNGIPFPVRIAANEINIRNAIQQEKHKPNPDQNRVERLEGLLEPIDDPSKTDRVQKHSESDRTPETELVRSAGLDAADDAKVDRRFIMFRADEGSGHMIEVFGEFGTGTTGVGVYVPGTSTSLDGAGTNQAAAWNLADQTKGPIFLYMEGDFPQDLGPSGAMNPAYAAEMAPKLVEFGKEVDREVAQRAPGTPVTYVGHSYGGSVVATAEQHGLRADRILHASSAGTGVQDKGWNNPNPNVQRYSMTAPGDLIGAAQSAPRDSGLPSWLDIPGLPERNPHGQNPDGTDPDEMPGVTRLDTGYYADYNGDGKQEPVFGTDGHGKYWNDPNSTAFRNIAGVISGGEVHAYVERGIETDWVDIDLGDDGDLKDEVADLLAAQAAQRLGKQPYADPQVTDNPGLGPTIKVT
ncbi:alpha/beta hydrolase [Nocardia sp. NPDC127579]|uniref:alpha/beta hydrolase n=1 Tax=Nocardia sp. NPDC127579 TaxID=3345402 RepID=UPI00362D0F38